MLVQIEIEQVDAAINATQHQMEGLRQQLQASKLHLERAVMEKDALQQQIATERKNLEDFKDQLLSDRGLL